MFLTKLPSYITFCKTDLRGITAKQMFEGLTHKLVNVFDRLRAKGRLNEEDVAQALREVRLALLEADVHYKVVSELLDRVKQRAIGQEVLRSLTPAQQVLKVLKEELIALIGGDNELVLKGKPAVLMLVGLQGSGKTTTAAKIGFWLKKRGYRPCLVAFDPYRPAAVEQLQSLADKVGLSCASLGEDPYDRFAKVKADAQLKGFNPLIIDTAGRFHIDTELMEELKRLKALVSPSEVLLVVDSMMGQDAVNVARGFDQEIGITGIVLTKMEGDAKGGAALSIKAVTGKPIKFVGTGEGIKDLEPFYPERIVSRLLGMGDVWTVVEKVQDVLEEKVVEREKEVFSEKFDLEDFRQYLRMMRRLGNLEQLISMLPGVSKLVSTGNIKVDERKIARMEAIINSMTIEERKKPHIINGSRRRRIARGSGTTVQEVNQLLKQYELIKGLIKEMRVSKRTRKWLRFST